MKNKKSAVYFLILFTAMNFLSGCVTADSNTRKDVDYYRPAKTVADYERAGQWWGSRHWNQGLKAGNKDDAFVGELVNENALDYFWVHSDLKDAFVKGYRLGYQDRTADLVLGPNVTEAAARIGKLTGKGFVDVISVFEQGWAKTLKRAIDVFITLISEGSQADRETFIAQFIDVYNVKFSETQKMLKEGSSITQMSEGGTLLFIDYSKGKTLGALDIPKPSTLKMEIYHQAFKVMGDELGRRFSTNLIKRNDLIDLLRRSKTALEEVDPGLSGNLGIIKSAFRDSYGTDADNVFQGIIKDAGYTVNPAPASIDEPVKKKKK